MLFVLTWRDLKARYKQATLGVLWAVLQPTLTMVAFSILFGRIAKIESNGVPYPIFAFAALIPWLFFSNGVSHASNCMIGNTLVTKVYFPRLIIPAASICSGLMDMVLSLALLFVLMLTFGMLPTWQILLLPAPIALVIMASLGVGMWLAALNAQYRDVRFTVPFMLQIWMFVSPVAYPAGLVSDSWKFVYGLNPLVGAIELFRAALCGTSIAESLPFVCASLLSTVVLLLSGTLYFGKTERKFADML